MFPFATCCQPSYNSLGLTGLKTPTNLLLHTEKDKGEKKKKRKKERKKEKKTSNTLCKPIAWLCRSVLVTAAQVYATNGSYYVGIIETARRPAAGHVIKRSNSKLVHCGRRGPRWPGRRPIRYGMVAGFFHGKSRAKVRSRTKWILKKQRKTPKSFSD